MIFLPYPPALNRYYRNFRGITVISAEGKAWKQHAAWQAKASGMKVLEGAVSVSLILHPKTKKDGTASKVRMDLDACCKAALDALNGVAYGDDRQIERLLVELGAPVLDGGLSMEVVPYCRCGESV